MGLLAALIGTLEFGRNLVTKCIDVFRLVRSVFKLVRPVLRLVRSVARFLRGGHERHAYRARSLFDTQAPRTCTSELGVEDGELLLYTSSSRRFVDVPKLRIVQTMPRIEYLRAQREWASNVLYGTSEVDNYFTENTKEDASTFHRVVNSIDLKEFEGV